MTPTTHRTIRVPDEIWQPAADRAAAEGKTMTDVIRAALERYGRAARSVKTTTIRKTEKI